MQWSMPISSVSISARWKRQGRIKLLNQSADDANDIAQLLHISDEERRYIENADVGSGLLIADKAVVPFHNAFPKNTELFCLMDTNPESKP